LVIVLRRRRFPPNFSTDGLDPAASLIFGTDGNLYGTNHYGGLYGAGAVFEIAP